MFIVIHAFQNWKSAKKSVNSFNIINYYFDSLNGLLFAVCGIVRGGHGICHRQEKCRLQRANGKLDDSLKNIKYIRCVFASSRKIFQKQNQSDFQKLFVFFCMNCEWFCLKSSR